MSHARAVVLMVLVTLMWSLAGVVTRHLQVASGFEITFWRSFFNALALILMLGGWRGPAALRQTLRQGGRALWLSGVCWGVMYTAFMMALTLTTVANVLVTMALAPLLTALLARMALGHRVPAQTWVAMAVASLGIAWMYGTEVSGAEPRHLAGMLVAAAVPAAAAVNWTVIQHTRRNRSGGEDMLPAVLIGAALSALLTLPLAWPFHSPAHDIGLLALLGLVQLAIPCMLVVVLTRVLSAPEVALLGLLEVVFGVAWAWLGAGEEPSVAVLGGGALVLGALIANEAWTLRRMRLN